MKIYEKGLRLAEGILLDWVLLLYANVYYHLYHKRNFYFSFAVSIITKNVSFDDCEKAISKELYFDYQINTLLNNQIN